MLTSLPLLACLLIYLFVTGYTLCVVYNYNRGLLVCVFVLWLCVWLFGFGLNYFGFVACSCLLLKTMLLVGLICYLGSLMVCV